MTVVVGTAGHIDHGKTTLLRALTGIDADRLPEEQRRGMTLDVGYAHMTLADGSQLDFVDVPGHDRLVGNMLVGAGEIDAALLVVAADDGPRPQTTEHLALLDALGVHEAVVAITKADAVPPERLEAVRLAVADLLAPSALAGAPVRAVSGVTGEGLEQLRAALLVVRDAVVGRARVAGSSAPLLPVDRVFTVKGRGVVVTGTLRGGPLTRGAMLRTVPGDGDVRVREIQVHGTTVEAVADGGRTALNIVGADPSALRRGVVLTTDPDVTSTERMLVRLAGPVADRARYRLHIGTDAVEAAVGRSGRDGVDLPDGAAAGILRLSAPVATRVGDRFVLRRVGTAGIVGGRVLDPRPARGVSRRRQTPDRVAALATAVLAGDARALAEASTDLHGVRGVHLARDIETALRSAAIDAVRAHHEASPAANGASSVAVRAMLARLVRRAATVDTAVAETRAAEIIQVLVGEGVLIRDGDLLRTPGHQPLGPDPALAPAMERLERALTVPTPPPLMRAAAAAACPPDGVRELERSGRIVRLEPDLAYAMTTYRELAATALRLAARGPLAPAAFRDATGTSRKYVMPILEDLDRRGILARTPAGHVPGPRAPAAAREPARPAS